MRIENSTTPASSAFVDYASNYQARNYNNESSFVNRGKLEGSKDFARISHIFSVKNLNDIATMSFDKFAELGAWYGEFKTPGLEKGTKVVDTGFGAAGIMDELPVNSEIKPSFLNKVVKSRTLKGLGGGLQAATGVLGLAEEFSKEYSPATPNAKYPKTAKAIVSSTLQTMASTSAGVFVAQSLAAGTGLLAGTTVAPVLIGLGVGVAAGAAVGYGVSKVYNFFS